MKTTPSSHITFYPADKLKNQLSNAHYISKDSHCSIYKAKIPELGDTDYFFVETVAKGEHEGLNVDNLISKIDKVAHHHLFSLEYYSYELNLDDRLRRNWDIWFLFEPFKYTLDDLVIKRRDSNSRLQEDTLCNLIKDMASLFAYLQYFNIKHKPIHPRNFLVVHDDSIKFDALDLMPYCHIHPEASSTPKALLSPEEVSGGSVKSEKAQVFQLGLIFLYAASTRQVDGLNTNMRLVKDRIAELTKHYSKFIPTVLKLMLNFNESERLSFEELYKYIKQNETSLREASNSSPILKGVKTLTFADLPKEEKKDSGFHNRAGSLLLSPGKESPERKGSHELSSGRYSFGKSPSQPSKIKTIESENLKGNISLEIALEKQKPKVKLLHSFIVGTKSLMIIPLINPKNVFVEVIELNIPFTIPSCHGSVYAENEGIYLIGGRKEPEQETNCYCYTDDQPTLNDQKPFIEHLRLNPGLCNIGKKIYVIGGSAIAKKATLSTCEVFNTEENEWYSIAGMHHKTTESLVCSFNDEYIYKFGGLDEAGNHCRNIEKYVIKLDKWIDLSIIEGIDHVEKARNSLGVQLNPNEILIFGGSDKDHNSVRQTYILEVKSSYKDVEKIIAVNLHCPKAFSIDESKHNQVLVIGEELLFLADNPTFSKVCSFDGGTWKELKKINTFEL